MKYILILLLLSSYLSANYNFYQVKPYVNIHYKGKRNKSTTYFKWANWDDQFITYYNECLNKNNINYLRRIKSNYFENKHISKRCYSYAKSRKSAYRSKQLVQKQKWKMEKLDREIIERQRRNRNKNFIIITDKKQ